MNNSTSTKGKRSNKSVTFFVCFLAALAGLLFGLDIGVIAGALPFISHDFQITNHQQEWVVSSMMFGAAVGAVVLARARAAGGARRRPRSRRRDGARDRHPPRPQAL